MSFWFAPEVQGQTTPHVTNLLVEIWPEYDRPGVLVIYRGELSQDTSFPAEITFPLPGYIETMHVVASEREGSLFEVEASAVQLRHDDQKAVLTFSVTSPRFQFEYYDSQILTQTGQNRSLNFEFATLHPIGTTTFEIQEPPDTEDFQMTPPSENSFTGTDGVQYHTLSKTGLTQGDTFAVAATYQRSTDELTVAGLSAATPPPDVPSAAAVDNNLWFGYLLVGLGVALLLVAGGSWWWNRQKRSPGRKTSSRSRRQRSTASPGRAKFCHQCGTPFRGSAKFCHTCGAERRYD